jgi:hypothetical protein
MARLQLLILVALAMTSAGCELAGDIFQAGAFLGALGVILVVALIAFLAMKIRS